MTRTWRTLGLEALLAAALAATPALAQDKTDSQKLDDIQKELGQIHRALTALYNVPKDLGDAKINIAQSQKDINQLREEVGRLERQMKELDGRIGQMSGRIAFSPPATGTGRIRLMNTYTIPVSIRVNSRVHRLEPGQTQVLEAQPAGTFTYEVFADPVGTIQPPVNRVLGANETYTIYVYPR